MNQQLDDALRQQFREAAKQVRCRFCGAQKGEGCVNPTSGLLLIKIPAHNFRLQDAGVFPRGGGSGG